MLSTCTSMPSDTAVGVWRKSADRHLWLRVSLIHGLNTEAVRLGAHSRFVIFLSRDTEVWELHLYLPVAELIRSFPPPPPFFYIIVSIGCLENNCLHKSTCASSFRLDRLLCWSKKYTSFVVWMPRALSSIMFRGDLEKNAAESLSSCRVKKIPWPSH